MLFYISFNVVLVQSYDSYLNGLILPPGLGEQNKELATLRCLLDSWNSIKVYPFLWSFLRVGPLTCTFFGIGICNKSYSFFFLNMQKGAWSLWCWESPKIYINYLNFRSIFKRKRDNTLNCRNRLVFVTRSNLFEWLMDLAVTFQCHFWKWNTLKKQSPYP